MDEIKEGLEKNVNLGVLEWMPENTPTTWCSRICVVVNKNGSPRRAATLNLSIMLLQDRHILWCLQATAVLTEVYKTCLDALEGYHSILIKDYDRHITMIVTLYRRYR